VSPPLPQWPLPLLPRKKRPKKGPSEVSLFLKGLGTAGKVAVIKAVQTITGLGLMDAKKLVDACPCAIKEKISPVEAEAHGKVLKDAGAEIEIK
jgi:large subunit ribosomal protein L7/L12